MSDSRHVHRSEAFRAAKRNAARRTRPRCGICDRCVRRAVDTTPGVIVLCAACVRWRQQSYNTAPDARCTCGHTRRHHRGTQQRGACTVVPNAGNYSRQCVCGAFKAAPEAP